MLVRIFSLDYVGQTILIGHGQGEEMKYATDKSHRDYFYKHGLIEFDALFSPEQVQELNEAIDYILCTKLHITKDKLSKQNVNAYFLQGHDLFRHHESLKKLLLFRHLGEIAAELMEVRSLRIGYDQLLVGQGNKPMLETVYGQFLLQSGSLQEKSSIKPVICGLILCLEPTQSSESSPFFSKQAGNGIFFKADIPFDTTILSHSQGGRYILIVYAAPRTVYILTENDPHTHALKHIGYVFGDKLSDKLNPIIIR